MRYAVWLVRLIYVAWMIPAGLNHFIRLYPQPLGNEPLSIGVFTALLDSGMFTLVKAVELLAGLALLLGIRIPLALVAVLPVSFTVWYWDTELQGWWTPSAIYGWAVMGCNLFLLYAYRAHYLRLLEGYAPPRLGPLPEGGLAVLRMLLGAVLLMTGIAWFLPALLPFVPAQGWNDPMAIRLEAQFAASGLLGVAKFIHVVAGLALLLDRAVPFVLAAAMPVNVCGAFIAVLIERALPGAVLALSLLALHALLMFAYLPAYAAMLAKGALADGEGPAAGENYESLYARPGTGAPADLCLVAAAPLALAALFYWFVVLGFNSVTGLVVLAFPALMLAANAMRAPRG